MDIMIRGFFLGFIKIHILYHASKAPVYGVELVKELNRHGYQLSYGTLYPVLHNLFKEGYLERNEVKIEGKIRKYYSITSKGQKALEDCKSMIHELVDEVLNET